MRIGARNTATTATTLGVMYAGRKTATPTSASVAAMAEARTTGKLIRNGSCGDGLRHILCPRARAKKPEGRTGRGSGLMPGPRYQGRALGMNDRRSWAGIGFDSRK